MSTYSNIKSNTKDWFSILATGLALLFLIAILVFTATGFNLVTFSFYEPKMENARREVFLNTKSYNEGMISDLQRYYEDYNRTSSATDKAAIRNYINMRFANFDDGKIENQQLATFLTEMRGY